MAIIKRLLLICLLLIAGVCSAQSLILPSHLTIGPGTLPMARVASSGVSGTWGAPIVPTYSLPSANYVGVWYAENYTNAGSGGVATITDSSIRADGVVRLNHMVCSVETQKPTLGQDSHGYYMQTDGGDVMISAPCSGGVTLGYAGSMTMLGVILPANNSVNKVNAGWMALGPGNDHNDAYFSVIGGNNWGWTWNAGYGFGGAVPASFSLATPTLISQEWDAASLTIRVNGKFVVRDTNAVIKNFTTDCYYGRQSILANPAPNYFADSGSRVYAYVIYEGIDHAKTLQIEAILADKYKLVLQ